jgi:hypothetical protein
LRTGEGKFISPWSGRTSGVLECCHSEVLKPMMDIVPGVLLSLFDTQREALFFFIDVQDKCLSLLPFL